MVVLLPGAALGRSLLVPGASGTGKSFAMEGWAADLVKAGYGVGVIDPHADLFGGLVERLSVLSPSIRERVVIIDPTGGHDFTGLNPLERGAEHPQRQADFLATVVTKLFNQDATTSPRMQQIMLHAFWLLIASDLTLVEFPEVLTDAAFRRRLLDRLPPGDHFLLRNYWEREFPSEQDKRLVTEWTQSSLNKVRPFVTDPALQRIFGQRRSTVDFRQIMDEGRILLVNLALGVLKESKTQLLGAFVIAMILKAAFERVDTDRATRRPWCLFIDEFHNFATDDIQIILSQTRKYGLSLVLAYQFHEQLRDLPKLQAAVMNTVQNLAVFRMGAADSDLFARDLFSPPIDQVKDLRVRKNPTGLSWYPYTTEYDRVWRALPEIQETAARAIKNLKDREFWYKRKGYGEAHKLRTLGLAPVRHGRAADLVAQANARYARPVEAIDAEIAARRQRCLLAPGRGLGWLPPGATPDDD